MGISFINSSWLGAAAAAAGLVVADPGTEGRLPCAAAVSPSLLEADPRRPAVGGDRDFLEPAFSWFLCPWRGSGEGRGRGGDFFFPWLADIRGSGVFLRCPEACGGGVTRLLLLLLLLLLLRSSFAVPRRAGAGSRGCCCCCCCCCCCALPSLSRGVRGRGHAVAVAVVVVVVVAPFLRCPEACGGGVTRLLLLLLLLLLLRPSFAVP